MDSHDLWNAALTIGVMFGGFMLNRVTAILDKLEKADVLLSKDISDMKATYVPKSEFIAYGDRLEKRLEQYQMMQTETARTIFGKLDIITERLSDKVSRAECASNLPKHLG